VAYAFVYGVVAIVAGAPANHWAPNFTHISFVICNSWIIYQYKTTIYKEIQNESAAIFNMAVGQSSFKTQFQTQFSTWFEIKVKLSIG